METLTFDTRKSFGGFKPMNGTNGGPLGKTHAKDQNVSNFDTYRAARIPFARNHDANICGTVYGGPYVHDVSVIFPDFDADPEDPASYFFENTDADIQNTLNCGTVPFYRLGQSIEHQIRKLNVWPPKDFRKWAVICEHIVRHYTEGWADGFTYDMPYWEIWCEPDLLSGGADLSRHLLWCGTDEQFYDFYETAAKHLKACFPQLKFGGPGLAHRLDWADAFLREMQRRGTPIDFFSWHCYTSRPEKIVETEEALRKILVKNGYSDAESILNEYNYIRAWSGEDFIYSVTSHINEKGAAFVMACMTLGQQSGIDKLLVYDTRPSMYNNFFDYYTRRPLKGYYALYWYGCLYDCAYEIRPDRRLDGIYTLAGVKEDGKLLAVVTHYDDDDSAADRELCLDFGRPGARYELYAVGREHSGELVAVTDSLQLRLPVNSVYFIKEC